MLKQEALMVEPVCQDHNRARILLTNDTGDQFSLPYVLELRPKAEFGFEPAKTKLAQLRIGEQDGPKVSFVIPGDVHTYDDFDEFEQNVSGRQAQLLKFAGWVSMDSQFTVCADYAPQIASTNEVDWLCWCCILLPTEASSITFSSWRYCRSGILSSIEPGNVYHAGYNVRWNIDLS